MIILSNPHHKLYLESDGKRYEVAYICPDIIEANKVCNDDPTVGVVSIAAGGFIIIAKLEPTP